MDSRQADNRRTPIDNKNIPSNDLPDIKRVRPETDTRKTCDRKLPQ